MTITTKENAVSTPAKFEVGKRYLMLPRKTGTVTVLKRNRTTIDFCLTGDELKIIRRKVFEDSVYAHDAESVSYGSNKHHDYFWVVAKDVVDETAGILFATSADNPVDAKAEISEADVDDYAVSTEAQDAAVEAESEQAAATDEVSEDNNVEIKTATETKYDDNSAGIETKIATFEVGKTYAQERTVLFDTQVNITVVSRTKCFVSFQIEDEDEILKRKVVNEYGVEKIYYHETYAIGGDFEFSAKNVVEEINEADIDDYAVTVDAQDAAVEAESEQAAVANEEINTEEHVAEMTIEVKTFRSGKYSLKLNGKKVALEIFNIGSGFYSVPRDTEIIFNGHKLRYIGQFREYFDTEYLFADENGNGIRGNELDSMLWRLAKFGTHNVSRQVAQIAADNKAYFVRTKIESEQHAIDAEYVFVKGERKPIDANVFNLLPDFTDEDDDDELIDAPEQVTETADVAEMQAKFDEAVYDSRDDDYAALTINGETILFADGKLSKIVAPNLDAEITFSNGRKIFRYRGTVQTKSEFFKRLDERADLEAQITAVENFMHAHGGHEIEADNSLRAPFVAQIHPVIKSGEHRRQLGFAGHFVTFTDAKKFVDDFKAFAGEMTFAATIKRGSFLGEECYNRGFTGKETVTVDTSEIDGCDAEVFSFLPEIGELNDTRTDIEKEFDEFDAEDTDRNDRFNRGERYAEKLTAKLRKFDATAEVTYDINEYDEDTYYLEFDGIYRTPFTLDGIESSFHELKRDIAEFAAETKESLREKTVELTRLKERLSEEQALAECTRDHLKISQTWMRAASKNSDNANFYAEQAEAIGATIEKLDERIADLTTQITAVKTELATVNKKIADFKHAA